MTNKTFTVAGTSVLNGQTKIRFANNLVDRIKVLHKNAHTEINLIDLPQAMTKADVCKFLLAHEDFQDNLAQSAITSYVVKNVKELAKELAPAEDAVEEATDAVEEEAELTDEELIASAPKDLTDEQKRARKNAMRRAARAAQKEVA